METLTIIVADTLRVAILLTNCPDSLVCKVVGQQPIGVINVNLTWVAIALIVAIVLLVWMILNTYLKCKKMRVEKKAQQKQHKWEVEAEDKRRYYKYQDQLLELKGEKANKILLLETLTTEINERLS